MTNELEKTFFDTFGIEKKTNQVYGIQLDYHIEDYPQITDRILLELICIISSNPISILFEPMLSGIKEVELLKKSILLTCIANEDVIKHQVRTLFEEG